MTRDIKLKHFKWLTVLIHHPQNRTYSETTELVHINSIKSAGGKKKLIKEPFKRQLCTFTSWSVEVHRTVKPQPSGLALLNYGTSRWRVELLLNEPEARAKLERATWKACTNTQEVPQVHPAAAILFED